MLFQPNKLIIPKHSSFLVQHTLFIRRKKKRGRKLREGCGLLWPVGRFRRQGLWVAGGRTESWGKEEKAVEARGRERVQEVNRGAGWGKGRGMGVSGGEEGDG
ncbi:hypothetical protein ACH5RR_004393 [Cinchona calisaya]|uniref:Uncharacterized protein n=1 Tax=Cinchona calisaya TaxID=153742 RepID=A0ABD3AYC3_9GENT